MPESSASMVPSELWGWQILVVELLIEPLADNAFAVFNGDYWDSFVFNELDVCLLRHLLAATNKKASEAELCRTAALAVDMPADATLQRYVSEALRQMSVVGLVRQVAPC